MTVSGTGSLKEQCLQKVYEGIECQLQSDCRKEPSLLEVDSNGKFCLIQARLAGWMGRKDPLAASALVAQGLPGHLIQELNHPFLLAESGSRVDAAWKSAYEKAGYPPVDTEDRLSWQQRYFAARVHDVFKRHYADFQRIDPYDLCFFYRFRHLVQVACLNDHVFFDAKRLHELLRLFPEANTWQVSNCMGLKEGDFIDLFAARPRMEGLDLSLNGFEVTTRVIRALSRRCHDLKELNLWAISSDVDPKAVLDVVKANPRLESLTLGYLQKERCEQLVGLSGHGQNLRHLRCRGVCVLNTPTLRAMLRRLPQLEKLELIDCKGITCGQLTNFSLPKIRSLTIQDCPGIDPTQFLKSFPQLAQFSWSHWI
jgi:hypothetical protein